MYIIIDDIKINYIDEGCGSDVLLLHGWGASIKTMQPIFDMLKGKFRTVALDLPGFGESDDPLSAWNSYDYADIVKKFIKNLGLKDIILFGHSHGGRVSIVLASQYDVLVKKLILIDSAGIISKKTFKYYYKVCRYKLLKRLYMTVFNNNTYKMDKFYKKFGSSDYKNAVNDVMRKTLVKVLHDDVEKCLTFIKVPTLIVWGDKDTDTPLYMAKKINKKISDSGLVILEGAGHYSYLDCFYKFKLITETFLKNDFS